MNLGIINITSSNISFKCEYCNSHSNSSNIEKNSSCSKKDEATIIYETIDEFITTVPKIEREKTKNNILHKIGKIF